MKFEKVLVPVTAMVLTAGCASDTFGPGSSVTEEGVCLNSSHTYELPEGESFDLAVDDLSVSYRTEGQPVDNLTITNIGMILQLEYESQTSVTTEDQVTFNSTDDEEDPEDRTIAIDEESDQIVLEEEGQTVILSGFELNKDIVSVTYQVICE